MLREFTARQLADDYRRRWFSDDYFDLYVWYEPDDTVHGFQLCYSRLVGERALTWTQAGGFRHAHVDSGENEAFSNATPVIMPGGGFSAAMVLQEFRERSGGLEVPIRELVIEKINEFAVTLQRRK